VIRIGVDVGGTFTKAVAVTLNPLTVIADAVTPTTHRDSRGVAAGVLTALERLLAHPAVVDRPILSIAHSTTQAVNALLEGDSVSVGIIGMGSVRDQGLRKRVTPGSIALAVGRELSTSTAWLTTPFTDDQARTALHSLREKGAAVIVASKVFGVDDSADEQRIMSLATEAGFVSVGGHQVTSAYGLEIRTITAAINASILPKMTATADHVESALRGVGLTRPLLVMRGDGGVMPLNTLRQRPILSLLSGPAASLAGALLFGRLLDGIFVEVGGTSTNIAVIQDGAPTLNYVQVMDHPTCIRSLDVRVQGIAGGSLARRTRTVGPRSAHIAGLPYLCYATPRGRLTLSAFSPQPGDPADYLYLTDEAGDRYALTVTCAAHCLGDSAPAHLSEGFSLLAGEWGYSDPQQSARELLKIAATGLLDTIRGLIRAYRLSPKQIKLIGGGGGAVALLPTLSESLRLPYQITPYAPVISSIGVALAAIREEGERGIDSDPAVLIREVTERALTHGADPTTLAIETETLPERGLIRVVATGALTLESAGDAAQLTDSQTREIAAERIARSPEHLTLAVKIGRYTLYEGKRRFLQSGWQGVIGVDQTGRVCLRAVGGQWEWVKREALMDFLRALKPGEYRIVILEEQRLIRIDSAGQATPALIATLADRVVVVWERVTTL
jgi:N-methylhydantoinase A/oxoprolinase/acetone carboxylase beta subunit